MRLGRYETIRTKLTKNDMARVIVQALHGLRELPNESNVQVLNLVRRMKRDDMERQHKLALTVIEQWIAQQN